MISLMNWNKQDNIEQNIKNLFNKTLNHLLKDDPKLIFALHNIIDYEKQSTMKNNRPLILH